MHRRQRVLSRRVPLSPGAGPGRHRLRVPHHLRRSGPRPGGACGPCAGGPCPRAFGARPSPGETLVLLPLTLRLGEVGV